MESSTESVSKAAASRTARIAKGDLRGLDELKVDALAIPLYALIRQPSSVAGYVDWRLAGRLGRLILKRRFTGALGEKLLMPSDGRIGAERIFLFGLGEPRDWNEAEATQRAQDMVSVLGDAGARAVALAPSEIPAELVTGPGSGFEAVHPRRDGSKPGSFSVSSGARLLSQWLEVCDSAKRCFEEVVLLDVDGSLVRAEVHLAVAARRGGLTWQG